MCATPQSGLAAPFDAIADRYDQTFTSSLIGMAQRAAVWRKLAKTFRPGDHILEIGCGTGVDACFLAERNVRLTAFDPSPQMIDVATRRIHQMSLQKLVRPFVMRAEDITTLPADELFDGVFSNFGALNCVEDFNGVARGLARLLKPGAIAVLCWMGPCCVWEIGWYLAQGNRQKAFRRFNSGAVSARIADGSFVHVRYPSVGFLSRAFAPEFRVKSVRGIGIAVPPSYLEPWARRHPRLLQLCGRFDACFGRCPGIRSLGDHVLVHLQREKAAFGGAGA
ncbi:MAG: class I SAM-dependent methyltransferase [Candidatus Sulfotelmatobacter sp.]|jgi:ubiquinone/menaquinone biosynthesis C-methylase UbiE